MRSRAHQHHGVIFETITLEVEDGLAHLILNRPEAANALNSAMAADLRRAVVGLAHDPTVRAVLLTRQGATSAPVEYTSLKRAVLAFIVAGGVGGILFGAIMGTPLDVHVPSPTPSVPVKDLGLLLMGPYAPALLIVGVLLTVALLGAVVIAAVDKPEDAP